MTTISTDRTGVNAATADDAAPQPVTDFIARWSASRANERANYVSFLNELCDLLNVPRPDPSRDDDRDNAYVFERHVNIDDGDGTQTTGRIDLYKRGCFVLEAKQGSAAAADDGPGLFGTAERKSKKRGTAVRGSGRGGPVGTELPAAWVCGPRKRGAAARAGRM